VPLLGALFAGLALSSSNLASNAKLTDVPAEALVYGVQGTFHAAAVILMAAAILTAVVWRMERSPM
jgi:hypothetical protein